MPENLRNGIVVFFHGNAEDIGMCKSFAYIIGAELQVLFENILEGLYLYGILGIWNI